MDSVWLWIPATIVAAAAQAGRNAVQRGLTTTLGTLGATQVRFLFGFPFALVFLALVYGLGDSAFPQIHSRFLLFVLGGALAQILATALMLAAMRARSFVVVTAWTKTEPIQAALFGFAALGDPLSTLSALAIALVTVGVVFMSGKPSADQGAGNFRPAMLGLVSGAFFALSAIGFRGAILSLDSGSFILKASFTLSWSLGAQVCLLLLWMALFNRALMAACMRAWRASLWGGFLGATASQAWFIGFALTAAANVRTLGLLEVLFAQLISRRVFLHVTSRRERFGISLIVGGVALLLLSAPDGLLR